MCVHRMPDTLGKWGSLGEAVDESPFCDAVVICFEESKHVGSQ